MFKWEIYEAMSFALYKVQLFKCFTDEVLAVAAESDVILLCMVGF